VSNLLSASQSNNKIFMSLTSPRGTDNASRNHAVLIVSTSTSTSSNDINFKNQNQSLISDLSTISAYIERLDVSVELANELFALGARKKDFRGLLSNFGEIKSNDFTQFYDNPLAPDLS
jgi:hypothetical protein